jgi:hypothetical protein
MANWVTLGLETAMMAPFCITLISDMTEYQLELPKKEDIERFLEKQIKEVV